MSHPRTPEQLQRHCEAEKARVAALSPDARAALAARRAAWFQRIKHTRTKMTPHKYFKNTIPDLTPSECAYVAGLVDGEGCFMMKASVDREGRDKINACFRLAMSHQATIKWLADKFGRSVKRHIHGRNAPASTRPMFRVEIANTDGILSLIRQIEPFLITKRAVAAAIAEFCESRKAAMIANYRVKPYTERERELCVAVRDLNRRGAA